MQGDLLETPSGPLRGPLRKRESSLWEREANDWYVEPRWCSERLFAVERFDGPIWDPSCGGGNIVQAALDAGLVAKGTDVVQRVPWAGVLDFLSPMPNRYWIGDIVSNPPFALCDDRKAGTHPYVQQALKVATGKVALLLPANWVQGEKRSRWLQGSGLRRVLFITPRPSMPPGQVLAAGGKPGNGTTDYAWFIWHPHYDGAPEIGWLRREQ